MLIIGLIYNLSVLVAIIVFSGFIDLRYKRSKFSGKVIQGVLFGVVAIIGMMNPVVTSEGIFFDGRSIVISLAALFFGPISGAISAIIAILFRLYLGGIGKYLGVMVVITSFLTGWVFYEFRRRKKLEELRVRMLLTMGSIVHLIMIALIFSLPSSIRSETFHIVGFTILAVYPVVTVIIGKVLLDQELNHLLFHRISENEELYKTTLFSISDGVITTDSNALIIQLNPVAEKLIGLRRADVIGKDISSVVTLINESTKQPVKNIFTLVLNRKKEQDFEAYDLVNSDGTVSPITEYSRPIFNETNEISGAVFVFRDKHNEIEHHKELIRSAKSYKGLFNSIKSAAYVQDREGRFLDINEGALTLYGYPRESFIGETPEFLAAPGMNDMNALAGHIQAAFNGESRQFEFWGKKRNGDIFPKEINLFKTTYFDKEAIIAIAHDITERKKIVSALSYSEERYRTLFNSSPVGIILEDLDGDIIEVNQTICNDFGYTAEALIGQNIEFLVPKKIRPQVKKNIKQIIEHGVLFSRVESVSKDNSIRISELIESLVVLPDGRKGILSISKNITEQVLAEQTLIKSEARNKAIISAIPDLFFRFDKTNKIIDCVAKESHLLYEKPENFLGKYAHEVLPLELAQLTEQKIRMSLETGDLQQYEYSMNLQDEIHWFEARMIKSSEEEVLVIVREITDRKKAEQEIQQQSKFIETLLESIPNPLFYMSNEGVFLGVNKAFREFYNYSSDAIVGKSLFDIDDQLTAIRNFNSDKLIFEGKETIQAIERGILLPSGEERSIILTKSPFPDSEGGIGGLIGLIVDISARKKMEKDLRLAKEKAEESDRLKTSFLNNLNHEIRTPLNAIVGFSDLLFEDYSEDQKKDFVETINNNADQLLRIIDDVLAVSRLDSEKIPLEPECFHPQALLQSLFTTFNSLIKTKSVSFHLDEMPESFDGELCADKGKIRQVLSGFISNSLKYTEQGSIHFGFQHINNHLRFYVKDTGIGIPEEEQIQVFNRFFRGYEPQIRAIRGNGLGLSIANGLVELMGSRIQLISESGVGSTFFFDIEIKEPSCNPKQIVEPQLKHPIAISRLSVLIVEDEIDNFSYLEAILSGKVEKIVQARTGLEAIRILRTNQVDLVLMDIKMPEMDGFEATKIIVSEFPHIPIIAQTAFSQPEEINRAKNEGCYDCLVKPIEKDKLFVVLNQLFGDNTVNS